MKTIEEAAKEISDKFKNSGRIYSNPESAIRDGFKAGVEFAQRWISVEEELPQQGDKILVKDQFENIEIGVKLIYKYFYTEKIGNVKYWRPIELK